MTADESAAAGFAAGLVLDDVPSDVVDRATLVLADSVGAILGGSTTPDVAALGERSARSGGEAAILGTDLTATPERAALVNGSAGTALELDEGHKYAAGHPAMHVLPAVLADAEARRAGGEELLASFVAGYEVCARVGMACAPMDPAYHMHGVWGTVGAAAGVARLRGYDAETTLGAMRIGANGAQHTCFDAALEGATVRNTYMGQSAADGVRAADEAAAGFTGLADGLARHLDRTTAEGFDRGAVADALGDRWEVARGYFKRHAACRYAHGALDALDALDDRGELDGDGFDGDDVASVRVETFPAAARCDEPRPGNALDAKFSIPFAVATRLLRGGSGKEAFAAGALTGEAYALAARVTVEEADDLAARVPDARSTRVTVRFADGREATEEIRHAKGDERNPFSADELREKFDALASPIVGAGAADALWEATRSLPGTDPADLIDAATTG